MVSTILSKITVLNPEYDVIFFFYYAKKKKKIFFEKFFFQSYFPVDRPFRIGKKKFLWNEDITNNYFEQKKMHFLDLVEKKTVKKKYDHIKSEYNV